MVSKFYKSDLVKIRSWNRFRKLEILLISILKDKLRYKWSPILQYQPSLLWNTIAIMLCTSKRSNSEWSYWYLKSVWDWVRDGHNQVREVLHHCKWKKRKTRPTLWSYGAEHLVNEFSLEVNMTLKIKFAMTIRNWMFLNIKFQED